MHPERVAEAPLSPAIVFDMLQAHQRTDALKAAIELDVFRVVGEGPGDVASIARSAGRGRTRGEHGTNAGVGYRGWSRSVRDRDCESESARACHRVGLGAGIAVAL